MIMTIFSSDFKFKQTVKLDGIFRIFVWCDLSMLLLVTESVGGLSAVVWRLFEQVVAFRNLPTNSSR